MEYENIVTWKERIFLKFDISTFLIIPQWYKKLELSIRIEGEFLHP
jgi:hypothetical protein